MKLGRLFKLILFVVAAELIGSIGTIATSPAIGGWYKELIKPFFSPPNWLFGPAWTILFALMGVSAFLVYEKGFKKKEVRSALNVFALQFVFNVAWSFIFFGGRMIGAALIEIVIMWFLILATIVKFYKISKIAGLLLIPYLLWVTFATILNAAVGLLNGF